MSPEPTIGLEFHNRTATKLQLWIEMCCEELELTPDTEYRLELDVHCIILFYQYSFGPKIFKRPSSTEIRNPAPWELVVDYLDIGYRLP